jgi:cytochrome c-type biogenesis protein CcmH
MTFWLLTALMVVAAVATVLPALLAGKRRPAGPDRRQLNLTVHRDRLADLDRQAAQGELGQEEVERARAEIERDLLRDVVEPADSVTTPHGAPWSAVLVGLAIPFLAVTTYLAIGSPDAARLPAGSASGASGAAPGHALSIERVIELLAGRLQADPSNVQNWTLLARSYATLERFPEARDAFAAASRLTPENPDLLAGLAETTALAAGGDLSGRPEELLRQALALQPRHADALWLAGLAAAQGSRYEEAVSRWETLLEDTRNPDEQATLKQYISEARQQRSGPDTSPGAAGPPPAAPPAETPPAAGTTVRVQVSVAPALQGQVSPTDTVFVFARPAEGSRMPLAIVRRTGADLPLEVSLDDSTAMNPGVTLANTPQIVIGARVSRAGSAVPQAGDLEGLSTPVSPAGSPSVDVRIDRQL